MTWKPNTIQCHQISTEACQREVTLATLYRECSFLYQNFLMPPYGRLFDTEKNPISQSLAKTLHFVMSVICLELGFSIYIYYMFISQPPIQHPYVDIHRSIC